MLNYGLLRNTRFLTIFNVAFLVILILSIMILVRDLLLPGFSPSGKPTLSKAGNTTDGVPSVEVRDLKDYEPLLRNNPFGFSGGELRPLIGGKDSLSLDVRLIGTVSGGIDYAVFLTKEGRQEVFRRGERVFDTGMLQEVYRDKVIISEGGRKREIPISDILTIETVRPESGIPSLVRSSGNNNFVISQEGIIHALENPAQLMTDARLQPNYVNGRQEGFMLREVRNGGIYQSLGLQNGDVLLRINNYDITNPEIALQAFTALKGMDRVTLDIMRNGSRMTLNYQIR